MQIQETFVPKQEIQTALGTFTDKKQEQFYQGMCKVFTPLEPPKPGDWLHGSKQAHQAFANYRLPFYNQVSPQRNTIYLQQFDQFNLEFIAQLTHFCSLFYSTLQVKCLPVLNFQKQMNGIKNREGYYRPQYLAQDILAYMEKRVPEDAYCVMGITLEDIYPGDSWLFVYGWAKYKARAGIFSFLRFDEEFRRKKADKINWENILYPSMRTMAHEIGHMFGITHCVYYRCLMNGFNGIQENYSKPFEFCPICYRKISTNIAFNFVERYTKLIEFCEKTPIDYLKGDQQLYRDLLALSESCPFKIAREVPKEPIKVQKEVKVVKQVKTVQKSSFLQARQVVKKQITKPLDKMAEKQVSRYSAVKPKVEIPKPTLNQRIINNPRGASLYSRSKK